MQLQEPVASLHRDLIKRWVSLVTDVKRRFDEPAHVGMARAWAQHQQQNLAPKGIA